MRDQDLAEAERDLCRIPDVRAARILATPSGRVLEVHVLTLPGRPIDQIAETVRAVARRSHGLDVSRDMISIVQLEDTGFDESHRDQRRRPARPPRREGAPRRAEPADTAPIVDPAGVAGTTPARPEPDAGARPRDDEADDDTAATGGPPPGTEPDDDDDAGAHDAGADDDTAATGGPPPADEPDDGGAGAGATEPQEAGDTAPPAGTHGRDAEPTPAPATTASAGAAPRRRPARLAIEAVTARRQGLGSTAEVVLRGPAAARTGTASGSAASSATLRLVAEATVDALADDLPAETGLALESATLTRIGERWVAVATVVLVTPSDEDVLVGTAPVRSLGEHEAVARAVLDATNRRLQVAR